MLPLIKIICNFLEQGEDLVLATVIGRSGSAPRTAGAKMAVRADGRIAGTIGGGLVEANAIEAARTVFETRKARTLAFDLNAADVKSSLDMICGGRVDVLLEFVPAENDAIQLYRNLLDAVRQGRAAVLVGLLSASGVQRVLTGPEQAPAAPLPLEVDILARIESETLEAGAATRFEIEGQAIIAEPFRGRPTLYLFGAGHVAQEVARLSQRIDFRTVVLDDRREFCNPERFATADELIVLDDFDHALAGLPIGADSYIVILTRGHSHDHVVLAQALQTNAGYIGMIGSRRKRKLILDTLSTAGFTQDDFDRVHSPIGLNIGAESPAEIAVSIVAELIDERARIRGREKKVLS